MVELCHLHCDEACVVSLAQSDFWAGVPWRELSLWNKREREREERERECVCVGERVIKREADVI